MAEEKIEQFFSHVWKERPKTQVSINYLKSVEDIENQPILILDEDPKFLAQYLTLDLIKKYIEYITYSLIAKFAPQSQKEKSGVLEKPRVDYMFRNQRTYGWFIRLYKEMQDIYKRMHGRKYVVSEYFKDIYLEKAPSLKSKKKESTQQMVLVAPNCYYEKYKGIFEPYEKVIFCPNISTIVRFRIMFIILGALNNEFPFGAPAWYSCSRVTIWKSFNKMTRLYYRIDTSVEGVYSYYYSVDNNSWTEIKDVPVAMRHLIDGIIFARET